MRESFQMEVPGDETSHRRILTNVEHQRNDISDLQLSIAQLCVCVCALAILNLPLSSSEFFHSAA